MNILLVGGGGREHAIAWKLSMSPAISRLFFVPGNGGLSELGECFDLDIGDNEALAEFALAKAVDLTVVGPEAPLAAGIADVFQSKGLRVFGPTRQAAQLEGSKAFAKGIMSKSGIPTAAAELFSDAKEAIGYLDRLAPPYVVKADGLAAGKGVTVAPDRKTAIKAIEDCLTRRRFGSAGDRCLIEECLEGQEVSVLAFTDGETVVPMAPAQDYKRVYDDDEGPNTGGMGSYCPVPILEEETYNRIVGEIIEPAVAGLAAEGAEYHGVIYAGCMLTPDGPKALEYNVRFGDPETQAILPRLKNDLLEVMLATVERNLSHYTLNWTEDKAITVVLASGGYPDDYTTGRRISGLREAAADEGVAIFHAGTKRTRDGVVTAGGRVLDVTGLGGDFELARRRAYTAISKIGFEDMHYRSDIGVRAITATERV